MDIGQLLKLIYRSMPLARQSLDCAGVGGYLNVKMEGWANNSRPQNRRGLRMVTRNCPCPGFETCGSTCRLFRRRFKCEK